MYILLLNFLILMDSILFGSYVNCHFENGDISNKFYMVLFNIIIVMSRYSWRALLG